MVAVPPFRTALPDPDVPLRSLEYDRNFLVDASLSLRYGAATIARRPTSGDGR